MTATTAAALPRRRSDLPPVGVWLSFVVLALLIVAAVLPNVFAPGDPMYGKPADSFEPPSAAHWFGTDQLGRDLFTRVIHGAWYSLSLGIGATLISLVGGIVIGVAAGYSRGIVDRILSRLLDVLLAFPEVLLALIIITILGPGDWNVILAIGIGRLPGSARLVRAQVIQVRESGYVRSGVALGLPLRRLVLRHVIPNSLGPVLVASVIGVGTSIIFGAALSFLGLGALPPTPEWGLMLSEARQYLSLAPWIGIWPGAFITLAVIVVTVSGRWLQQRFVSKRSSL